MNSLKSILLISMVFVLAGCAMHKGPHENYALKGGNFNLNNAGLVIGRVTGQRHFGAGSYNAELSLGRDFCIRDLSTNMQILYGFAKEFQLMLPPGKYEFYGMGNPTGNMLIPEEQGFKFSVRTGEITYIGSVVGDRDLSAYSNEDEANTFIPHRIYCLSAKTTLVSYFERHGKIITNEPIKDTCLEFFIIDESDQIISNFKEAHPEYKDFDVSKILMK